MCKSDHYPVFLELKKKDNWCLLIMEYVYLIAQSYFFKLYVFKFCTITDY